MAIKTSFDTNTSAADAMDTLNRLLSTVAAIPPLASFGVATLSLNEGNSGTTAFVFPVILDKVWSSDIVLEYVTVASATLPASASDFVGGAFPRGIITIPAGSTTANISIPVAANTTVEPNKNFIVRLYRVAASSVGTILNDDVTAVLSSLIVQIGDSIPFASRTGGYSAINKMGYDSSLVTINNTYAQDGHSLAQIPTDVPGGLASLYDPARRDIAIIQRITNDFGNNQSTAATAIALVKTSVNLLRSQGFYVGLGTCLPRTVGSFGWTATNETQRQIYNTWVRSNVNVASSDYSGHDFVLDFAADSVMGASGANTNTALYSDGTHPTTAGQDYLTPIYREAVRPFLSTSVRAPAPLVTLSTDVSQNEGNSGTTAYTFTATRTVTGTAINVPWTFSAGSTSASDYVGGTLPAGGTLAFGASDLTKTITINVAGDVDVESTEAFSIALQAGTGYYLGSTFSATGTVVNDDSANPSANYVRLTTLNGSGIIETATSPGYSYVADATASGYSPAKFGYSGVRIPASTDGSVQALKPGALGPVGALVGLTTSTAPSGFSGAIGGTNGLLLYSDSTAVFSGNTGTNWLACASTGGRPASELTNLVPVAAGDIPRVRRANSSTSPIFIGEVSKDGGATFTEVYRTTAGTGSLMAFVQVGNTAANGGAIGPLIGSANMV